MPYLQLWKGKWRVRKPIPKSVQAVIGRGQYLTRGLGTSDRTEADRLSMPVLAEFQDIIERAERGDWPPLSDDGAEVISYKWAGWAARNDPEYLERESSEPAFATEEEFKASVTAYLAEHQPSIRPGTKSFEKVRGFARGECTIEKPIRLSARASLVSSPAHPEAPSPSVSPYRFSDLLDDWARERLGSEKTRYSWGKIIKKLIKHLRPGQPGKFYESLDYDASAVSENDLIGWKDKLVSSKLSPTTIKNHFTVLRTLYNFAKDNKRIPISPAAAVKYRGKPKGKARSYTDDDAKRILEAARRENAAHLRWVPWIGAFTGARLEEICGANAVDVYEFGGIWVLDIRLDHRGDDASLKTEGSERKIPLHPALVSDGFVDYVRSLPKNGPLFPGITPDRFGSRGGNATKTIGRWIRSTVGIADPRKAPNHAWRHRFKSICRRADIEEEYHEALTGHTGEGSEGREYGEYEVQVLYREICKIKSPVDQLQGKPEAHTEARPAHLP
jgi:integrase